MRLTPELTIFGIFLLLAAVAICTLIAIASAAHGRAVEQADIQKRGYWLRSVWFRGLAIIAGVGFLLSLPTFPYQHRSQAASAQHHPVTALQFAFVMPPVLPVDTPIVLDVTATDVNHGVGIYDPDGRIVAQVQAMPGYTNSLSLVLKKPGQYVVLCMEYCGIAHHLMRASFEVR
jgi:cytochrome c oxidase subunit 2